MIRHLPSGANARAGAILIMVAGITSLLVALSVAFLARMRSDAEENLLVLREAQARIMLVAGCSYIQEASRLGWDDPATPTIHEEGFGWVDVRDGKLGPKPLATGVDDASRFPIGHVMRSPMHVLTRPPFATQLTAVYNPIINTESHADIGVPWITRPDPQPVVTDWDLWRIGDRRPRSDSMNLAWFRVCRVGPARFVITCGAGPSQGFKNWTEVLATPDGIAQFSGDQQLFEDLVGSEARLWYLVEWSSAVQDAIYQCLDNEQRPDHYAWRAFNTHNESRSQAHVRNQAGTISWIQRLEAAPADGIW